MDEPACGTPKVNPHHWLVASPDGPRTVIGRCKKCKAEREYIVVPEEMDIVQSGTLSGKQVGSRRRRALRGVVS